MTEAARKVFMPPPQGAEPFFEAARQGRLLIQRCNECGRHQFYPRQVCVHCGAPDPDWVESSGRGVVHTFTVVWQQPLPGWRDEVPYVAAVVDLEEGVRITSNIVDCPPETVAVGMPVAVTFREEGGWVLPRFRPL